MIRSLPSFSRHSLLRASIVISFSLFSVLLWPRPLHADKFDVEAEKLIGRQVANALKDGAGVDEDPLLADWVKRLGATVSAASPRRDITCDFTILGTDAANALAAPGGHIFVTRGLLDAIDSEDELAVVLAHETGHHSKRHGMQQVGANALFLLGLSFVDQRKEGLRIGLVILNALRTLKKSREMEAQADDLGLGYAAQTGYDPAGLIHFFEGFDLRKRSRIEEYFATHPAPDSRMKNALKNPLVTRTDPATREATAKAYESRGLYGAAKDARAGRDPLALPEPGAPFIPPFLQEERNAIVKEADDVRNGLSPSYSATKIGNTLQTLLLVNGQDDLRWLYVSARAYALQSKLEDLLARTVRVARTIPSTYDALARYAEPSATQSRKLESALGRGEVREALKLVRGAPTPLGRSARAIATVLTDLNNRFWKLNDTQSWLRYGTLEGLLRYAESELSRADKMSGMAWRQLSLARIRRYQEQLTDLIPEDNVQRRAIWYDLTQRRLGRAFDGSGPAGPATIRAALAVEFQTSTSVVERRRGDITWADWVMKLRGVPENVATATRLLAIEIEREIAAVERYEKQ